MIIQNLNKIDRRFAVFADVMLIKMKETVLVLSVILVFVCGRKIVFPESSQQRLDGIKQNVSTIYSYIIIYF